MTPHFPFQRIARWATAAIFGIFLVDSGFSEDAKTPSKWNIVDFIDGLPDALAERLPSFDTGSSVRLYARPHLGDFIHRDYLRLPIGARIRADENIETIAELQTYFTHGFGDSAGYGISGFRIGTKVDHVLPSINDGAGVSVGFNYLTPLSRPPFDLTDGYRHFSPYVSATRPFLPEWPLLGYATVSADLIDRTPNRPNFGKNQLHSNSLSFSAGAAHEFARFRGSLTATFTTSSLITNENENVFAIRPEVVIPWKMRQDSTTQIFVTLGGRSIWGPDGNDLGVSSSVRFEFLFRRKKSP